MLNDVTLICSGCKKELPIVQLDTVEPMDNYTGRHQKAYVAVCPTCMAEAQTRAIDVYIGKLKETCDEH